MQNCCVNVIFSHTKSYYRLSIAYAKLTARSQSYELCWYNAKNQINMDSLQENKPGVFTLHIRHADDNIKHTTK